MKKLLLFLCFAGLASAQNAPIIGSITASGADCFTTNACITAPLSANVATSVVQLTGVFVATVQFEASSDLGVTWAALNGTPQGLGAQTPSATATGVWVFSVSGQTNLRVRCSAFTSGTVQTNINSSLSPATYLSSLSVSNNGTLIIGAGATPGNDATSSTVQPRSGAATGAPLQIAPWVFDGTNWDKARSAALATFPTSQTSTARNSIGAQVSEKGSRFVSFSNPAAGSQGSLVWAAEASVRHVADCVTFAASSIAAPALTALTVNLRDGASGAGTILATWTVAILGATGQNVAPFGICGLNAVGTTNTAMTIEFSAALAQLSESVSFTGYNVN